MSATEYLERSYANAIGLVGSEDTIVSELESAEAALLNTILSHSESAKGVLTVFITSLVYKSLHPEQDIRNHQDSIPNGYSGRTFDTKYVTPFLKHFKFPAMAESGWLTRSLEHKVPYDLNYSGAINPSPLKQAFLKLLDNIQNNGANASAYLSFILQGLIIKRNSQMIDLAKPTTLSIATILGLLEKHFRGLYNAEGASRLPVLAFYAIYECLVKELKRFEGAFLQPIESHTSADSRSGRIGDIDIINSKGRPFEAVEVKYDIPISLGLVKNAYSKFQTTPVARYYILSTAPYPQGEEMKQIQDEIKRIKNVHGCQLIINGVMPTLNYYLRLLGDPFEFVNNYVNLLENDTALKFEHKARWNSLIAEMD